MTLMMHPMPCMAVPTHLWSRHTLICSPGSTTMKCTRDGATACTVNWWDAIAMFSMFASASLCLSLEARALILFWMHHAYCWVVFAQTCYHHERNSMISIACASFPFKQWHLRVPTFYLMFPRAIGLVYASVPEIDSTLCPGLYPVSRLATAPCKLRCICGFLML